MDTKSTVTGLRHTKTFECVTTLACSQIEARTIFSHKVLNATFLVTPDFPENTTKQFLKVY